MQKHFLIVENDPNDAMLIRMAFHAANCGTSFVCRNASEAKAYIRGAGMYGDRVIYPLPDAVITDLRMGAETGIDLVRWIRAEELLKDVPIIILSGSASPLEMESAKSLNIHGVHRKPNRIEDLKALLWNLSIELCEGIGSAGAGSADLLRGTARGEAINP